MARHLLLEAWPSGHCAGVWRSASLVPGLSAQAGPGALGHQDLALNVRMLAMERLEMLMPLLHQTQELGAWGYNGTMRSGCPPFAKHGKKDAWLPARPVPPNKSKP